MAANFFIGPANGSWTTPANWSDGAVPDATDDVVIDYGKSVSFNATSATMKSLLVNGSFKALETAGVSRSLSADWIMVHGAGALFQIGTSADRYTEKFTITLEGDTPLATVICEYTYVSPTNYSALSNCDLTSGTGNVAKGNNAFLMAMEGGQLSMFGESKTQYRRLSATAAAGTNTLTLGSAPTNWRAGGVGVGDQIAVASTDEDSTHSEVFRITAISGNVLTLDHNFAYSHFGGATENYTLLNDPDGTGPLTTAKTLNQRAEVAVLTRNILIQGDANSATDGYGGNLMFHTDPGSILIDGIQLYRMGQKGRLGRYPIHWHRVGDGGSGDYLKNSSIFETFNRAVTIHDTNNVLIANNVAYDNVGHAYFLEDATETGNTFDGNIGMRTRRPGTAAGEWVLLNDVFASEQFVNPDGSANGLNVAQRFVSPATFWISNPDNTFTNNIAAGSQGTGYWFALPSTALPDKATGIADPGEADTRPRNTPLRLFSGNTSHSSTVGLTADQGEAPNSLLGATVTTAWNPHVNPADLSSPPVNATFSNYTAYQHSGTAIYLRELSPQADGLAEFIIDGAMIADSLIGTFVTYDQIIKNSVYVGASVNNGNVNQSTSAHKLYDGPSEIINSSFYGYGGPLANVFVVNGGAEKRFTAMFSSLKFDAGSKDHLGISSEGTQNSATAVNVNMSIFEDTTGSVSGTPGAVIVPAAPFMYNSDDVPLPGATASVNTQAYKTDNRYAGLRLETLDENIPIPHATFTRVKDDGSEAPVVLDGVNSGNFPFRHIVGMIVGDRINATTYADPLYTYEVRFDYRPDFFQASMFDALPGSTAIVRLVNVADKNTVIQYAKSTSAVEVASPAALRSSTVPAYFRSGADVYIKLFDTPIDSSEKFENCYRFYNPQAEPMALDTISELDSTGNLTITKSAGVNSNLVMTTNGNGTISWDTVNNGDTTDGYVDLNYNFPASQNWTESHFLKIDLTQTLTLGSTVANFWQPSGGSGYRVYIKDAGDSFYSSLGTGDTGQTEFDLSSLVSDRLDQISQIKIRVFESYFSTVDAGGNGAKVTTYLDKISLNVPTEQISSMDTLTNITVNRSGNVLPTTPAPTLNANGTVSWDTINNGDATMGYVDFNYTFPTEQDWTLRKMLRVNATQDRTLVGQVVEPGWIPTNGKGYTVYIKDAVTNAFTNLGNGVSGQSDFDLGLIDTAALARVTMIKLRVQEDNFSSLNTANNGSKVTTYVDKLSIGSHTEGIHEFDALTNLNLTKTSGVNNTAMVANANGTVSWDVVNDGSATMGYVDLNLALPAPQDWRGRNYLKIDLRQNRTLAGQSVENNWKTSIAKRGGYYVYVRGVGDTAYTSLGYGHSGSSYFELSSIDPTRLDQIVDMKIRVQEDFFSTVDASGNLDKLTNIINRISLSSREAVVGDFNWPGAAAGLSRSDGTSAGTLTDGVLYVDRSGVYQWTVNNDGDTTNEYVDLNYTLPEAQNWNDHRRVEIALLQSQPTLSGQSSYQFFVKGSNDANFTSLGSGTAGTLNQLFDLSGLASGTRSSITQVKVRVYEGSYSTVGSAGLNKKQIVYLDRIVLDETATLISDFNSTTNLSTGTIGLTAPPLVRNVNGTVSWDTTSDSDTTDDYVDLNYAFNAPQDWTSRRRLEINLSQSITPVKFQVYILDSSGGYTDLGIASTGAAIFDLTTLAADKLDQITQIKIRIRESYFTTLGTPNVRQKTTLDSIWIV